MSSSIVLNAQNIVNAGNNTLVYQFPSSVTFPHHEIAVQSISLYYSWMNVNGTTLNNNRFQYTWIVDGVSTPFPVIIPPGMYQLADINSFLQYTFISRGQYLIDADGNNVYYAEFLLNPNRYAVQINTFPVPTALPTNWSTPIANPAAGIQGWPGFPPQTFNPSLIILQNFNLLVGFAANFTTSENLGVGTNLSYISSVAPEIQPNSSIYFSMSNIQNKYSNPSTIIFSLSPNVGFGEQITEYPPQFAYNTLTPGTYNTLRLQILGIDKTPLAGDNGWEHDNRLADSRHKGGVRRPHGGLGGWKIISHVSQTSKQNELSWHI